LTKKKSPPPPPRAVTFTMENELRGTTAL